MSEIGQQLTKEVYENPDVVQGYIQANALTPKMPGSVMAEFVKSLPGRRLLDLGCGPGHDSYTFTSMGCEVVGLDYSNQMIAAAKKLRKSDNPPNFIQGDMRQLVNILAGKNFDGIWASASLLHIPEADIDSVLSQIFQLLVDGGKAFIAVKGGPQGESVVEENKYGPTMKREFTFWEPDNLKHRLLDAGFQIDNFTIEETPNRQKAGQTSWLNYWITKP